MRFICAACALSKRVADRSRDSARPAGPGTGLDAKTSRELKKKLSLFHFGLYRTEEELVGTDWTETQFRFLLARCQNLS
jgi:hypothetical protein